MSVSTADIIESLAIANFERRVIYASPEDAPKVREAVRLNGVGGWITVEVHPFLPTGGACVMRECCMDQLDSDAFMMEVGR